MKIKGHLGTKNFPFKYSKLYKLKSFANKGAKSKIIGLPLKLPARDFLCCCLPVVMPIFFTLSYSVRDGMLNFLLTCSADFPAEQHQNLTTGIEHRF